MPTYFCLDFLFCTHFETKVTFQKSMQLDFTTKMSYCLSRMRHALPCSRINNTTSIDRKGRGQSLLTSLASATTEYKHTNLGIAKPPIWFHFSEVTEDKLASSWRNAGTDLLILLSLSGWENGLSGCEGTVETKRQHFHSKLSSH